VSGVGIRSGKESNVRQFRDSTGREWEVVVGRESWGTVVAIFVARGGTEPPREAMMEVSSADEGNRVLLSMSVEELHGLLLASKQKQTN
jgi:hypothetical protein